MSHIIWEREYWRNMQTYIPAATPLLQTTPLLHFLFNACYAGFGQWTFRFKRIGKGQSKFRFGKDAILNLQLLSLKRDVSLDASCEESPSSLSVLSSLLQGWSQVNTAKRCKLHHNTLSGQLLTYKYANQGDVSLDALPPRWCTCSPPCASQRAQRGINSGVNFANFAKIQYICSCPLHTTAPHAK